MSSKDLAGQTDSERYLVRLAKKAFLSLWCYPNVYTNEGQRGKGDGKELCDLLVVFGNDIILFSDKHCKFSNHPDVKVAWSRWYRSAIRKSVEQLKGAEHWIQRFPEKVFLDKKCVIPLPIDLPLLAETRIHLVAVTRGSSEPSKAYWGGGSSGSLYIDTELVGNQHQEAPFRIGWALPDKRFVHVFDEMTLDIVLNELDTISDFIDYLTKKEKLFNTKGLHCAIAGEEELIALYLSHFDYKKNEHYFPTIPEDAVLALVEGDWKKLIDSPEYASRREANKISYTWDNLIEFQNQHIIHGHDLTFATENSTTKSEKVMRIMASENRITRRGLGEAFHVANSNKQKDKRFTRTIMDATKQGRAYVFMATSKPKNYSDQDYVERRRADLLLYADKCKWKFSKISEVIGIVFSPGQKVFNAIDFLYVNYGQDKIPAEYMNQIEPLLKDTNMWEDYTIKTEVVRRTPYPESKSYFFNIKLLLKQKIRKIISLIK